MLKYWLAILLVLNAAVLAWQWDAFARWGYGPNQQREPERLKQQVRPEAIKIEVMPPVLPTAEPAVMEASDLPPNADASAPEAANQPPALSPPASEAIPTAPR